MQKGATLLFQRKKRKSTLISGRWSK